jgi:hypothetical protein
MVHEGGKMRQQMNEAADMLPAGEAEIRFALGGVA